MSIKSRIKLIFIEKENRKYEALLAGRKVTYTDWLAAQEAQRRARTVEKQADIVIVQFAEGNFTEDALAVLQQFFAENPKVQVVYTDEDVRGENGEPQKPWFKPDWSPDLLDSYQYFGSFVAVTGKHFDKIKSFYEKLDMSAWESLFSNKKDNIYHIEDLVEGEKWLHHCTAAGLRRGADTIGHIPDILFYAKAEATLDTSEYLKDKQTAMMRNFFEKYVLSVPDDKPVISIVIPSKDHPEVLTKCLQGIRISAEVPCEILVVDNGSSEENKAAVQKLLADMAAEPGKGAAFTCEYIYEPMEFNFSRMCNLGAEKSKGDILLFLNDDVELTDECISELAARAIRSYTGAVGVKLLYPEENRIQHAGITSLPMGPVHKLQTLQNGRSFYKRAGSVAANYTAVTAACVMMEKSKFNEVGGFEESLAVAFNDVDLCYKLAEEGYFNVCVNSIAAYHYESLSRGADDMSKEKTARLMGERDKLFARHPQFSVGDPFYSDHLNRDGLDVRIAPGYMASANQCQENIKAKKSTAPAAAREDACLMVRFEDIRGRRMVGYSVVLGDNNACYNKELVLEAADGTFICLPLVGQYRPDLEENMPDQTNVALSGIWVEIPEEGIPAGEYRLGVYAVNRVTGTKLFNRSNRWITLE